MTPFNQQAAFMQACGQTTDTQNFDQAELYLKLIIEECNETEDAMSFLRSHMLSNLLSIDAQHQMIADVADGAIDTIYVCLGLLHSLGLDPQPLWDEVQRSNMSKAIPVENGDGTVTMAVKRREDGKILKPATFSHPNLLDIVKARYAGF